MNHIDALKSDWKTLIILDACRYDSFKDHWYGDGDLTKLMSIGTNTPMFYNNLPSLRDVTLITANPFPLMNESVKNKFRTVLMTATIDPKQNILEALRIDGKRKMIHLIPPHMPPVSKRIRRLWDRFIQENGYMTAETAKGRRRHFGPVGIEEEFYKYLNGIGIEPIAVYHRNLIRAIDVVIEFLDQFEKPVVISSDHGELFGESGRWGHSLGVSHEKLREIPWLYVD